MATDGKVSRIYSNFRGVDFRGEEINILRSPDAVNMWKDYKETESIRTRPALSAHAAFSSPIYGIFFYRGEMLVHSGSFLYKIENGTHTELYTGLAERESQAFVYESDWYFKDGRHYLRYDGEQISPVVGYIPTTTIGRKPMGGGTRYEDVNMISDYRKNTFLADGASFSFYLDVIKIDDDFVPTVTVNGETVSPDAYEVDYADGRITFINTPPDAPLTDGQDNVSITFKKAVPEYQACIYESTMLTVFDNRVFFSGNAKYPNLIWHCSLNEPTYISDSDYYKEGMDLAAVKGMVAGNNALWVFREPSDTNTTIFYHTPSEASDGEGNYYKIYPSAHSSVAIGCNGKAINFCDDIVFFSVRGMEGISGDITTEQVATHRSSLIDRKLTAESDYENMILTEWEGYLLVFIGSKVYLADSRATFQNDSHYEYEWFYWELEKDITAAYVSKGVLYLGTLDGYVYTFSDRCGDVPCYWTTPKDKFDYPQRLKTTNKRGCVAEAVGDIKVYAKLEDTDFEEIGEYLGVTDYFVSRIKRKKFKDIQLKFASSTRFSLESITLECYIGGYIKR